MSQEMHIKDTEVQRLRVEFTHLPPASRAALLAMVGAHTIMPTINEWDHPTNYAAPLYVPGGKETDIFLGAVNMLAPRDSSIRRWNTDRVTHNARKIVDPTVYSDLPHLLRQIAHHVACDDVDATIPRKVRKTYAKNGTCMEYAPHEASLVDAAKTVANRRIQQLLAVADMDLCYGIQLQENGTTAIDPAWAPQELLQFMYSVVPNGKPYPFKTLEEMLATMPFQGVHFGILLGALADDSYHLSRSGNQVQVALRLNSHLLHGFQKSLD